MKTKQKARDRREAAKISWSPPKLQTPAPQPQPPAPGERARMKAERKKTEAEETREFLEYIGKIDMKIVKEEERDSVSERRKPGKSIQAINLEEGMPVVEDAIRRMNLAIQECRSSGIRKVKLNIFAEKRLVPLTRQAGCLRIRTETSPWIRIMAEETTGLPL